MGRIESAVFHDADCILHLYQRKDDANRFFGSFFLFDSPVPCRKISVAFPCNHPGNFAEHTFYVRIAFCDRGCLLYTSIENFVKNFAKSYYTWNNSKEAIEARTQAISSYLTKELQDLNVDTIRTDIPTSSTAVSYTHLDVYKRQVLGLTAFFLPKFQIGVIA